MTSQPSAPKRVTKSPVMPRRAGSGPTVAASTTGVSPDSAIKIAPRLLSEKESIVLIGDTTTGKSYAYMRMAHKEFENLENWDSGVVAEGEYTGPKFFLIDTDSTAPKFMTGGREFGHLYFEHGGNVYPYPARNWQEARGAIAAACEAATEGDWIIVDTLTRLYEEARDLVAASKGIVYDDSAFSRGVNKQGFGGFEAGEWNVVSITHDAAFNAIRRSPAHFLGIMHVTEYVDTRERRETRVLFDQVGLKPRGRPTVPSIVDTVCVIWTNLLIMRDERNRRTGSRTERWIQVLKDRGEPYAVKERYDRDFYEKLQEIRSAGHRPTNVLTDEEAAQYTKESDEPPPGKMDAPDANEIND